MGWFVLALGGMALAALIALELLRWLEWRK